MKPFFSIEDIRSFRWLDPLCTWGLVPTMGFLHEGHLSLVRRARRENDRVGVSIFVNPAQFNNAADLARYPSNLERDLALLETEGVDLVWTPTSEVAYPQGYQTYVSVERLTRPLEGDSRPGHFRGVATIVSKLFNVFQPQKAYFGQKDAQQALVVKQMVRDLNFNVDVVVCPTVREPDGLAMSSRNANLTPENRKRSACLYRALTAAAHLIASGERDADIVRAKMRHDIEAVEAARVEYISVAHPETLAELDRIETAAMMSLAVFMGEVRLIDNVIVNVQP